MNRNAGFTLIELMVVLVVIAIMSAVIVGEMGHGLQDALLRSSSRQLISVFDVASSRAISLNRLHRVYFDRLTGRYAVEVHGRGDEFSPVRDLAGGEGTIDPRISVRVQDPDDAEVDPGQPEQASDGSINFYPDGTTDGRELVLRDRDGFGLILRLNAITSRVQIMDLPHQ